jgi:hypothetical membrane protein
MFENRKIHQYLSLSGLLGGVFYFFHIVIGRIFYKGYNPLTQAVSDLTALDSPSRNIASVFSMLYGICTVIFSVSFFAYYKGKLNKIVISGAFSFCIMTAVSFFGYTFFPLSSSGYTGTVQDRMHILVTVLVVAFTIFSLILFFIGFFRTREYKSLGIISLCAFFLLATGAILINITPKEYFGVAERINIYSVIVYTCILSLWMHKYIICGNSQKKKEDRVSF